MTLVWVGYTCQQDLSPQDKTRQDGTGLLPQPRCVKKAIAAGVGEMTVAKDAESWMKVRDLMEVRFFTLDSNIMPHSIIADPSSVTGPGRAGDD